MKIVVCIGSSCHLKGSKQVVEQLSELIEKNGLKDKVILDGCFCMGNCQNGVSVMLDKKQFSLTPVGTKEFFQKNVLNN